MGESARQLPQLLTIAEAAKMLGMDALTFRKNYVNKGMVEFIALGKTIKGDRFHPDEIQRVRESLQVDPRADPGWDVETLLPQCKLVYRRGEGWLEPHRFTEYMYVLRCLDAIKVGISQDPNRRVKDLQAANPYLIEIELVYKTPRHIPSIEIERLAHATLKPFHLRGEWFKAEAMSLFGGAG
jgi:hypothetical protein